MHVPRHRIAKTHVAAAEWILTGCWLWHLACKHRRSSVNLFYLEESIRTYESLIAAFHQRRAVLLARRKTASGEMRAHIEESLELNEGTIRAMESALRSAQENFGVANGLNLAKKPRADADHETNPHA